jgi:hypothetical protein
MPGADPGTAADTCWQSDEHAPYFATMTEAVLPIPIKCARCAFHARQQVSCYS